MNGKWFYRLFYKGFLKYQATTIEPRENLIHAFTDVEGNNYYTWPSLDEMPKNRYDRFLDLYMYWVARMSPKTLEEIRDSIVSTLDGSLDAKPNERTKFISTAIVMANELVVRRNNGLPSEIFLDMAALVCVGEKENASIVNPQIEQRKVEVIAKERSMGRDFFLRFPGLMRYLSLSNLSRTELRAQFDASTVEAEQKSRILKHLKGELEFEYGTDEGQKSKSSVKSAT